jgi:hypothetical protein
MGGWISHLSDVCPSSSTNCRQIDHQSIVNHLSERRHWECWKIVVQKNIICCFFSVAAREIRVTMCTHYVNLNIQRARGGYRPWFGRGTGPDVMHPSAWFGGTWNEVAWWNFHHPKVFNERTWSIVESLHPSYHVTLSKPNPVLGTPSQNTPSQNGSLEWWSFARKGAGTSAFNQLCVGWSKFSLFSFLSRNAELMNDAWHDFGDRKQDYLSWISFTRSWRYVVLGIPSVVSLRKKTGF